MKAPYREWANQGLVTLVDDVSISPSLLTEYIAGIGTVANVRKFALDHFRWTLVSSAFKEIGVDAADKERVKLIRPSDIMRIVPSIQEAFDREKFAWGNDPCLRWGTNNTKRVRASKSAGSDTGNFYYAKIEAKSRKTDPFMALVAAMCVENILDDSEGSAEFELPGAFSL